MAANCLGLELYPAPSACCMPCMQTNTVTKKNSGARNLHRLVSAVSFVANLLANVVKDPTCTLRQVRRGTAKAHLTRCNAL